MASPTAVGDSNLPPAPTPPEGWYDDSVERYTNPAAYARKHAPAPVPELQKEISLVNPGGQNTKLEVRGSWYVASLLLLLCRSFDPAVTHTRGCIAFKNEKTTCVEKACWRVSASAGTMKLGTAVSSARNGFFVFLMYENDAETSAAHSTIIHIVRGVYGIFSWGRKESC